MAVVAINVGEMQIQAVVTVPAIPAWAAAEAMKWATDRIGPAAWVIAGVLTGGGIYWYCKQPPERRERIRKAAGEVGTHLMNRATRRPPRAPARPACSCAPAWCRSPRRGRPRGPGTPRRRPCPGRPGPRAWPWAGRGHSGAALRSSGSGSGYWRIVPGACQGF